MLLIVLSILILASSLILSILILRKFLPIQDEIDTIVIYGPSKLGKTKLFLQVFSLLSLPYLTLIIITNLHLDCRKIYRKKITHSRYRF